LDDSTAEIRRNYIERVVLYKNFGYDIEEERKFIIEKAKPLSGRILEVGTGKGYFSVVLAGKGYNFLSVDVLAESQEVALSNLEYFGLDNLVDLKVENAESLSFKDSSFGVVFSVNMIHHLRNSFKAVDEFVRVISDKGKIVLSDFSRQGLELVDKVHALEGKGKHHSGDVTLKEISLYLFEKGFTVENHSSKFQDTLIFHR